MLKEFAFKNSTIFRPQRSCTVSELTNASKPSLENELNRKRGTNLIAELFAKMSDIQPEEEYGYTFWKISLYLCQYRVVLWLRTDCPLVKYPRWTTPAKCVWTFSPPTSPHHSHDCSTKSEKHGTSTTKKCLIITGVTYANVIPL